MTPPAPPRIVSYWLVVVECWINVPTSTAIPRTTGFDETFPVLGRSVTPVTSVFTSDVSVDVAEGKVSGLKLVLGAPINEAHSPPEAGDESLKMPPLSASSSVWSLELLVNTRSRLPAAGAVVPVSEVQVPVVMLPLNSRPDKVVLPGGWMSPPT